MSTETVIIKREDLNSYSYSIETPGSKIMGSGNFDEIAKIIDEMTFAIRPKDIEYTLERLKK